MKIISNSLFVVLLLMSGANQIFAAQKCNDDEVEKWVVIENQHGKIQTAEEIKKNAQAAYDKAHAAACARIIQERGYNKWHTSFYCEEADVEGIKAYVMAGGDGNDVLKSAMDVQNRGLVKFILLNIKNEIKVLEDPIMNTFLGRSYASEFREMAKVNPVVERSLRAALLRKVDTLDAGKLFDLLVKD